MLTTCEAMPCASSLRGRLHGDRDLRAAGQQDDLRLAAAGQDVGPPAEVGGGGVAVLIDHRHALAAQEQRHRLVAVLEDVLPRLGRLVGVGGPDHQQIRDRPQGREVLDRLMGRAVLAQADAVVRADEDRRVLRQGRHADRAAHVIGEDQEGPAVRAEQTRDADAVHDRAHAVLAHAVADDTGPGGRPSGNPPRRRTACCSTASGPPSRPEPAAASA